MALFFLMLFLTGCGSSVEQLSQEQEKLVTEYATQLLVSHCLTTNKNLLRKERLEQEELQEEAIRERNQKIQESKKAYEEALQAEKEENHSDAETTESTGEDATKGTETETAQLQIGDFLNIPDFLITYNHYEVVDSYPSEAREDDFLSITPEEGNQLLVLHFTAQNKSSEEKVLDIFEKELKCYLKINEEKPIQASTTLLVDDFSMFREKISSAESKDLVLLFEIKKDLDIQTMKMKANCGGESATILLE